MKVFGEINNVYWAKWYDCRFASAINCDEEAINETFGDHKDEKPSFRNKSTEDAIKVMNNKMCDAKKRLSRQQYLTREKKMKLEEAERRMKGQSTKI